MVEQSCKKASPSCWLSSLPDDIAINCLARVSRFDLASLSMVSKSCRSLVLSPDLYETRSRMGCTEECVYVFFETHHESKSLWFILRRVKGKSYGNRLIPIPSFPTPMFSSVVAFGGGIYVIGGLIESKKTSIVSFLDCRTHTWSYLPSMRIARHNAKVCVLEGKIYVIGGYDIENNDFSYWTEVFDPKMQTWSGVNIQNPEIKHGTWQVGYMYNFRTKETIWNDLNKKGYCDVKRLLYCCDIWGRIMWCEPWSELRFGRMIWRKVFGLDDMQKSFGLSGGSVCSVGEMADVWHWYMLKLGYIYGFSFPNGYKLSISGGNIIIFWNKLVGKNPGRIQIWCTEISMEKRGVVWGTSCGQNMSALLTICPILEFYSLFLFMFETLSFLPLFF